jgi:hypothetical protein
MTSYTEQLHHLYDAVANGIVFLLMQWSMSAAILSSSGANRSPLDLPRNIGLIYY